MAAEIAHAYGHALAAYAPAVPLRERLRAMILPRRHRWSVLLGALAVCAFPVHLTVLAPAEVVASDPFLVRAPLDGVIDRLHVDPNQPVKKGEPLFDLDTTTERSRLGIARKAYEVAQEEYRQAAQRAVTDNASKADIATKKGELEEKALELDYSKNMLDRVQVKAARDGVAVFADVNDWQGKAVATGERVLLLADPARVELAVSLPVSDAIDLPADAAITLYPDGSAFTSYDAVLTSAAYRAEATPSGLLAYRLKARFTGTGTPPRLGLMGTAKVRGGRVPLAYYALRRPLASARQWLGW
jgi:multidrug efflux pump subunit AcrA (membrane-fusion protein)